MWVKTTTYDKRVEVFHKLNEKEMIKKYIII